MQACVLQGASISPGTQPNRAAPHSPSSSSRDGDSHLSSGAAETYTRSGTESSSSSSSWDNDSHDGSDGAAYQQSTRRKHTASRGHCRKTGTAGQAVAPSAAAAAAVGTSSLTSDQGAVNTRRRTLTHALPSPQCTPPHLVWCQSRFDPRKDIKIPRSLCTDINSMCGTTASTGVPMQLSVVVHPALWSVREYVVSQQPAPPPQPGSTPAEHGSSAITATATAAAETALAGSPIQQAGGGSTDDQVEAGSTVYLGPFTGSMKQNSDGTWVVRQLQHNRQLWPYGTTHQVVFAERVRCKILWSAVLQQCVPHCGGLSTWAKSVTSYGAI